MNWVFNSRYRINLCTVKRSYLTKIYIVFNLLNKHITTAPLQQKIVNEEQVIIGREIGIANQKRNANVIQINTFYGVGDFHREYEKPLVKQQQQKLITL